MLGRSAVASGTGSETKVYGRSLKGYTEEYHGKSHDGDRGIAHRTDGAAKALAENLQHNGAGEPAAHTTGGLSGEQNSHTGTKAAGGKTEGIPHQPRFSIGSAPLTSITKNGRSNQWWRNPTGL